MARSILKSSQFQSFQPFNCFAHQKRIHPVPVVPNVPPLRFVQDVDEDNIVGISREFGMRDRRRYLQWVFEARKRLGLSVLNYTVTSNHIHLLVNDTGPNGNVTQVKAGVGL
jgi:hypothetical protein